MPRTRLVPTVLMLIPLALATTTVADEGTVYGEAPAKGKTVKIAKLLADPERWVGETVKVEGRITDVCPRMGCWIDITQKDETIRFKVQDGVIEFGTDTQGHDVVAEGVLTRVDLDREQAIGWFRHLAEEKNEPFDPESITGPMTIYRIDGKGAIVR